MVESKNSFFLIVTSFLLVGILAGAIAVLYDVNIRGLIASRPFTLSRNTEVTVDPAEQGSVEGVTDNGEEVEVNEGQSIDRIDYPVLRISQDSVSIFAPEGDDSHEATEEERVEHGFGRVYKDIY